MIRCPRAWAVNILKWCVLLNVLQFERNLEWIGRKPSAWTGNSTGILWVKNGKTTVRTSLGQRSAASPKSLHGKYLFSSAFWLFSQNSFRIFWEKKKEESMEVRGVCFSQRGSHADFTIKQQIWCPPVPPLQPHLIYHHTWTLFQLLGEKTNGKHGTDQLQHYPSTVLKT